MQRLPPGVHLLSPQSRRRWCRNWHHLLRFWPFSSQVVSPEAPPATFSAVFVAGGTFGSTTCNVFGRFRRRWHLREHHLRHLSSTRFTLQKVNLRWSRVGLSGILTVKRTFKLGEAGQRGTTSGLIYWFHKLHTA